MELSLISPPPLLAVLFLALLLQLFRYYLRRRRGDPRKQPRAHGLKVYPLLGTLPHLIRNRHRFLEWSTGALQRSPTQTMSFHAVGFGGGVVTANPANVEHFLKTNFGNYPKGEVTASMAEDLLGRGILNSDGHQWLWQRKAASHEFSTRSLRAFAAGAVRSEAAERLLPLLARAAHDGRTLDVQAKMLGVQDVLQRFAFDNICIVAFGEDPACLAGDRGAGAGSEFMRAFDDAQSAVVARLMSRPRWVPPSSPRPASATRSPTSSSPAATRRRHDRARGPRGARRRAVVIGRRHAAVRPRRAARHAMHYLHAAITESMRLYPPVAINTRRCERGEFLPDGTFVGGGWQVSYSAYAMARVAAVWGGDCEEFRPERWLDGGGAFWPPESPFKYPVFHAGPRACLGREMAYVQMKSVAACVLERFTLRFAGGEGQPELVPAVTLRMKGGLPMQVKERRA
ncbi:unnamed protein product [Urochloa decumbens]|uniref:Uncharacterized protein n=1 Tax=Urochloa decumbens TaxID=240449 RepID=A0ABC9FN45_9POAL